MKKYLLLLVCIGLPLLVGGVSGYFTVEGVRTWFTTLQKPAFNPPAYLFAPVWTTLYVLMGISLFLVVRTPPNEARKNALIIFGVQLTLNFFWSILFFYFHQIGWALAEIIAMWICILLMIVSFYKIHKTAALLQIPYLLWVSFATLLNASLFYLNGKGA